jgi:steroid delta-isomerase
MTALRPGEGPTAEQVRRAVEDHCRHWNDRDQVAWTALFADDVTFDDPVGVPTKHGVQAVRDSWERSLTPGRSWRLVPERIVVCADEAAVQMRNEGTIATGDGDRHVVVHSIEIWTVRADGRVGAVRAYFEPDPAVNTAYFVPH